MRRIYGPVLILIACWLMLPQLVLWYFTSDAIGIAGHPSPQLAINMGLGLMLGTIGIDLSIIGFRKRSVRHFHSS